MHKGRGTSCISRTDQPRRYEFGIRTDGSECPHVAVAEDPPLLLWDVLLLGVAERPDFVHFQSLARQIPKYVVLVFCADFTEVLEKLGDRVPGHANHPCCGSDGATLDQGRHDSDAFFSVQLIHNDIILERSGFVNYFYHFRKDYFHTALQLSYHVGKVILQG